MRRGLKSSLVRLAPLIARRRAASHLGAALINPALSRILKSTFPRLYGANWINQLAPLTENAIRDIIETAVNFFRAGVNPKNWPQIKSAVAAQLPEYPSILISKVLSFISGIGPEIPGDYAYLTTGSYSLSDQIKQSLGLIKSATQSAAYEAQDKVKRGGAAVVQSAISAQNSLPWYMRPRTLLILGGLGVGMFYIAQAQGILGAIIPRRSYRSNPVKRTAKERLKAEKLYKEFHARKPRARRSIPAIDTGELVRLGTALELGYESDKWTGKKEDYLHEFGKGVNLYATADGKTLILNGGSMCVKDTGINN